MKLNLEISFFFTVQMHLVLEVQYSPVHLQACVTSDCHYDQYILYMYDVFMLCVELLVSIFIFPPWHFVWTLQL